MLILFDIDATLVTTSRSGLRAMEDAGRELFGSFTSDGIDFAGRLDPLIIADLLRVNGREASGANVAAMREGYRRNLGPRLAAAAVTKALPGVQGVIEALAGRAGVTLGLLTGNYADTGEAKLRACGIDPSRFAVKVWGDDSPHDPPARYHLGAVGLERYRKLCGREVESRLVTIIGDTPHDVDVAKKNGCRSLGVGTGQFSVAQLMEAGADHAVETMGDVEAVVGWLMGENS